MKLLVIVFAFSLHSIQSLVFSQFFKNICRQAFALILLHRMFTLPCIKCRGKKKNIERNGSVQWVYFNYNLHLKQNEKRNQLIHRVLYA